MLNYPFMRQHSFSFCFKIKMFTFFFLACFLAVNPLSAHTESEMEGHMVACVRWSRASGLHHHGISLICPPGLQPLASLMFGGCV